MMKKEQPKQSNKQGNKSADNKAALEFVTAARAFEKSEIDMVRRNSKIAWRIAGVSLLLVGLMAGAIAGLTPLKQVQPFVVRQTEESHEKLDFNLAGHSHSRRLLQQKPTQTPRIGVSY